MTAEQTTEIFDPKEQMREEVRVIMQDWQETVFEPIARAVPGIILSAQSFKRTDGAILYVTPERGYPESKNITWLRLEEYKTTDKTRVDVSSDPNNPNPWSYDFLTDADALAFVRDATTEILGGIKELRNNTALARALAEQVLVESGDF